MLDHGSLATKTGSVKVIAISIEILLTSLHSPHASIYMVSFLNVYDDGEQVTKTTTQLESYHQTALEMS